MHAIRRWPSDDEVLDGATGTRARCRRRRSVTSTSGRDALEHDREAVANERGQVGVVDTRAGDDETVGMLRAEQGAVRRVGTVGCERLDHDPEAARAGGRGQPAQGLGQDGVARDLLGRLTEHEAR